MVGQQHGTPIINQNGELGTPDLPDINKKLLTIMGIVSNSTNNVPQ